MTVFIKIQVQPWGLCNEVKGLHTVEERVNNLTASKTEEISLGWDDSGKRWIWAQFDSRVQVR